ncbi:MAG: phosphatidylserine decarboxylase family protein [Desulfobulbus propionicus]|nr:MAG: phosphatidylserine decarboxylase family protein [Desulfobulbus propionicus]
MKKEKVPLALEGYPFILFAAFAALVFGLLDYSIPALISLVLCAFATWFFRDPVRITPAAKNGIISPADGKVIRVATTEDERFFQGTTQKISIFMNVFNVHVNRIPLSGTVSGISFKPGKFYAADNDTAALHNEYCAVHIETESGKHYWVVQIAGLVARRIVCRLHSGDTVSSGMRYGMIRFGSRLDLYLPVEAKLLVSIGDKVKAGESLLGYLE